MQAGHVSFTFFGPVDGIEVKTYPIPSVATLYYPPPVNDIFELGEGGAAVVVLRRTGLIDGEPLTWVGFYQQAYEKGLRRNGHSFGVGLWFTSHLPSDCKSICKALITLQASLTSNCFNDNSFCDSAIFSEFVNTKFAPKFTNFCDHMFPQWVPLAYETGLNSTKDSDAFYPVASLEDEDNLSRLLAWALWAPGAISFQRIVFANSLSGRYTGSKIISDLDQQSAATYLDAKKSLKQYKSSFFELEAELAVKKDEIASLSRSLANTSKAYNEILQTRQNPIKAVPPGVQAPLDANTNFFKQTLAENISISRRLEANFSTLTESSSAITKNQDSNFFWTNINIIVFLFLIVGCIIIFAFFASQKQDIFSSQQEKLSINIKQLKTDLDRIEASLGNLSTTIAADKALIVLPNPKDSPGPSKKAGGEKKTARDTQPVESAVERK